LPTPVAVQERKYSEDTAREIDRAVREIVRSAFERAQGILKRHRNVLEDAALDLLRKETLTEPDVAAIAKRLAPRAPQQPEGHSQGRPSVTVTNS
jgi:cell division protease FtsH